MSKNSLENSRKKFNRKKDEVDISTRRNIHQKKNDNHYYIRKTQQYQNCTSVDFYTLLLSAEFFKREFLKKREDTDLKKYQR